MAKFHEEAKKIHELGVSLENISNDDGKEITDYTQAEIVDEARYVLSTFFEGGHCNNDDLTGKDKELRSSAKRQVAQLKRLIKKYNQ
jgi:hypothetical protein